MKKLFTLIELIIVIVVIGILASIIITNANNTRDEATKIAIENNIRNLQIAIDTYMLKNNGELPVEGVTEFEPKPIDFNKLNPKIIRNLPKIKGVK